MLRGGSPVGLGSCRASGKRWAPPFLELCRRFRLRLALDQVHYFSHWFTPEGPPRRYDTRFFVTAAPPQEGTHDDGEPGVALTPKAALAAWEEIQMIYPTHSTVRALATFEHRAGALAAVARRAHRHLVTPDDTLAGDRSSAWTGRAEVVDLALSLLACRPHCQTPPPGPLGLDGAERQRKSPSFTALAVC